MPRDHRAVGRDEEPRELGLSPDPWKETEDEIGLALDLLRFFINAQGFTQLEIQGLLGWGRSYISQLLTQQKTLRFHHLLVILRAIGTHPLDFFVRLYTGPQASGAKTRIVFERGSLLVPYRSFGSLQTVGSGAEEIPMAEALRQERDVLATVIEVLESKKVIDREELAAALAEREGYGTQGPELARLLELGEREEKVS